MKKLVTLFLCGILLVGATPAFAADDTTMRVVVVQTDDPAAYAEELREGRKIMSGINAKMNLRAWQATFAGPDAGSVVVALTYPGSLSEFSMAWEQLLGDEQMAEWLSGLSDLRTIVSDSLYTEIAH